MKYIPVALLSASLLNLSAAPYHFGVLAMVAWMPLLWFMELKGKPRFFLGWGVGVAMQAMAYGWIFLTIRDFGGVHPALSMIGAVLFWLFQGLDVALWFWLFPFLGKNTRIPLPAVAAACWYLLQTWLFPYIFPWVFGSCLVEPSWLGAGAVLWTDQGVGAIAVAFQVWAVTQLRAPLQPKRLWPGLVLLLLLLAPGFPKPVPKETLRVAVIQANLIPWAKRGKVSALDIFIKHYEMSLRLANQNIDLILWPETAVPFHLSGSGYYENKIRELARTTGAAVATGVIDHPDENSYYNAVYFYAPGVETPQIYRKEKLVPFSEDMPWFLRWAKYFVDFLGGFSPGENNQPFQWRGKELVPLVCYEALFSDYVERFSGDVLLNFTNDAWFGKTKASALHLQQIRMRCIEGRRPMVRATNSGISCWIDAAGRVHEPSSLYEQAVPVYDVPVNARTPRNYARFGGRAVLIFSVIILLLTLKNRVTAYRTRRNSSLDGNRNGT